MYTTQTAHKQPIQPQISLVTTRCNRKHKTTYLFKQRLIGLVAALIAVISAIMSISCSNGDSIGSIFCMIISLPCLILKQKIIIKYRYFYIDKYN